MKKAKQIPISNALVAAVYQVWQQIGLEIEEHCGDNREAIEACIDADRLHPSMGFVDDGGIAYREMKMLDSTYGWDEVTDALTHHPRLRLI